MGATEIDADVARIRKLLDALDGRAGLRVDPNEAWQETDALRVMPMLEEAGVELVEQPVPREQMAAMANITARARVPVMIDEGAQSEAGALETVRLKAAHIVSLKLMKAGGLRASKRMADIAAAGGLALYMGTFLESSLGTAADLQLAATLETLPYGGEIVGPMLLADDIVTQPIVYENGAAILPEGPGLGVALDEDKVRSLTRR